jgi:hypothetical protein
MKYAVGALAATALWLALLFFIPMPEGKIYDCSLSEFHPDYPPSVKEECRKKRMEKNSNITV